MLGAAFRTDAAAPSSPASRFGAVFEAIATIGMVPPNGAW
jgi:hypothetical protein